MNNTQIIIKALMDHGMDSETLEKLMVTTNGDLPFHTIPEWVRRGYHLKDNEKPLFSCYLWKYTDKPSAAIIKAAEEKGQEIPETSGLQHGQIRRHD